MFIQNKKTMGCASTSMRKIKHPGSRSIIHFTATATPVVPFEPSLNNDLGENDDLMEGNEENNHLNRTHLVFANDSNDEGGSLGSLRRTLRDEFGILVQESIDFEGEHYGFCFHCSTFFRLDINADPFCTRCNSTFIQFLNYNMNPRWITPTQGDGNVDFTFDNQLDEVTNSSLALAQVQSYTKKTSRSFLDGLETTKCQSTSASCSICCEMMNVDENLMVLPCHHTYHDQCILHWLSELSNTCPVCRMTFPIYGENSKESIGVVQADSGENSCGSKTVVKAISEPDDAVSSQLRLVRLPSVPTTRQRRSSTFHL